MTYVSIFFARVFESLSTRKQPTRPRWGRKITNRQSQIIDSLSAPSLFGAASLGYPAQRAPAVQRDGYRLYGPSLRVGRMAWESRPLKSYTSLGLLGPHGLREKAKRRDSARGVGLEP